MKNIAISILMTGLMTVVSVSAHIEPGIYKGLTADGQACQFEAGANYYLEDVKHPLNERIDMIYNGADYVVQHPPIVDEATTTVHFNHDAFHGVLATPTGGKALIIHMLHTDTFNGPGSFTAIDHQWKTGLKVSVTCLNIKKQ